MKLRQLKQILPIDRWAPNAVSKIQRLNPNFHTSKLYIPIFNIYILCYLELPNFIFQSY